MEKRVQRVRTFIGFDLAVEVQVHDKGREKHKACSKRISEECARTKVQRVRCERFHKRQRISRQTTYKLKRMTEPTTTNLRVRTTSSHA